MNNLKVHVKASLIFTHLYMCYMHTYMYMYICMYIHMYTVSTHTHITLTLFSIADYFAISQKRSSCMLRGSLIREE